jgi:hypothetical protein
MSCKQIISVATEKIATTAEHQNQSWQQSSRLEGPLEAFENNTSKASQAWGKVNDQSMQV